MSGSVSPRARASDLILRLAAPVLALALAGGVMSPAAAQDLARAAAAPPLRVVVADMAQALRASRLGAALRAREAEDRAALQAHFDDVRRDLEARERELLDLRKELPKEAFDALAQEFDTRVRAERQDAQEQSAALRARFERASEILQRRAAELLAALADEREADLVLRRDAVLFSKEGLDATTELARRIDSALTEAEIDAALTE